MVISPQPEVISPHNRSYFAPYKSHFAPCISYFAPCKKLVKFVVNFSFTTDFELNTMTFQIVTNAASSRIRLNRVDNTKYHFVRFSSTWILVHCSLSKYTKYHFVWWLSSTRILFMLVYICFQDCVYLTRWWRINIWQWQWRWRRK